MRNTVSGNRRSRHRHSENDGREHKTRCKSRSHSSNRPLFLYSADNGSLGPGPYTSLSITTCSRAIPSAYGRLKTYELEILSFYDHLILRSTPQHLFQSIHQEFGPLCTSLWLVLVASNRVFSGIATVICTREYPCIGVLRSCCCFYQ